MLFLSTLQVLVSTTHYVIGRCDRPFEHSVSLFFRLCNVAQRVFLSLSLLGHQHYRSAERRRWQPATATSAATVVPFGVHRQRRSTDDHRILQINSTVRVRHCRGGRSLGTPARVVAIRSRSVFRFSRALLYIPYRHRSTRITRQLFFLFV